MARRAGVRVRSFSQMSAEALLHSVDLRILVARPDGRYDPETLAAVPHVRRAGAAGPSGWNRAILRVLKGNPTAFVREL